MEDVGAQWPPLYRKEREKTKTLASAALDLEGFNKAWKEGESMTPHEAVTYALAATGMEGDI